MSLTLAFATSNSDKFAFGQQSLADFGIDLVQTPVEKDEIQGEEAEKVVRDKALKAYAVLKQPVIVSDDWWDITALGGFPGAYMKSINHWFKPEDFIALMRGKADRRMILHAYLGYYDGTKFTLFQSDIMGQVATSARGSYGPPAMHITELPSDDGRTISETYDIGLGHDPKRVLVQAEIWQKLGAFLQGELT